MKTHKVIDLVYHEDENNITFIGTQEECEAFKHEQGYGYSVVPMTKQEKELQKKFDDLEAK